MALVKCRINYNFLLIFKVRLGQALSYIAEMLTPYEPVHSLRASRWGPLHNQKDPMDILVC